MSTLKKPLLVLAALFGLWVLFVPWTTIRYRLSVEVETPEGVKNGSGVNMAGYSAEPEMFGARPFHHGVWRGEAIPVDLGARGTFYVLLTGRSATTGQPDAGYTQSQMLVQTLAPDIWQRNLSASTVFRLCFLSGSADVPHKLIPFLVRFRDEKDPKTVEAVDPANLAASFGPGVTLKRVWVETVWGGVFPFNMFGITGARLTTGIEKRLGWLPQYFSQRLDGDRSVAHPVPPPSLANALSSGLFKYPKE